MYLFVLIGGILLLPQSFSLKCNKCKNLYGACGDNDDQGDDTGEREQECPAAFTRCGIIRYNIIKSGKIKGTEYTIGSCFKADECKNGSYNYGVSSESFTTKCCSTDNCNRRPPRLSTLKPTPNGVKCYRCNERGGECTGTQTCVGDQVYCATRQKYGSLQKGCATMSVCVSAPSALTLETDGLTCCQGNYCNGDAVDTGDSGKGISFSVRTSSSASVRASLLLLSMMLMPFLIR